MVDIEKNARLSLVTKSVTVQTASKLEVFFADFSRKNQVTCSRPRKGVNCNYFTCNCSGTSEFEVFLRSFSRKT